MESIEKLATAKTPRILFDVNTGVLLIEGRSIPNIADEFWAPLIKWVYAYCSEPNQETKLIFSIEYFNNTSAKQILFILHKLNDLFEKGFTVTGEWKYRQEDKEMKEAGFDFSCMVNFPFVFVPISKEVHINS